ncbi:MAG: hypothetical protein RMJ53_09940 [Chitinophagales bacterium]|nr:hypothetical protein [Chitinophagales bacterium]MDW8274536.1 hypothetical protein [Chitinophagales bacterium]
MKSHWILIGALFTTSLALNAQDDVYFDPWKNNSNSNIGSNFQDQYYNNSNQNQDNTLPRSSDPFSYDEANRSRNSDRTDGYSVDPPRNSWDDEDFFYTSRLRRFYAPTWGCGFWDPWYTDMFFYTGNPWLWGSTIYVNVWPRWSWWGPNRSIIIIDSWGWNRWGWNDPWWGWGPWAWNGWGWNSWGWFNPWDPWNNWAWYNGYWNGYWNGFYDGRFGYWNNWASVSPGWQGRNYDVFGPRFQTTATNSGANSLPGKFGKTDETTGGPNVTKPGFNPEINNSNNSLPNRPGTSMGGWQRTPNSTEDPNYSERNRKKAPSDIYEDNRVNRGEIFNTGTNRSEMRERWRAPENNFPRTDENRNNRLNEFQRAEPRFNESGTESPRNVAPRFNRTEEMRQRLNKEFEPVERPQRPTSPRFNEQERNMTPRPSENRFERREMQRFDPQSRPEAPRRFSEPMQRAAPMNRNFDAGGMRRTP